MDDSNIAASPLIRRAFLRDGSLYMLGAGLGVSPVSSSLAAESKPIVRLGLVTDMHYADKPPAGSRHYRETLAKLEEAAAQFQKDQPEFVVELGDFIDAADSVEVERGYLQRINGDFAALPGKKHYVLGNHCVYTLTKDEFLEEVGQKKSFYSFDAGRFHFVVLDACFRSDGQPYGRKNFEWTDPNIPADQLEWLKRTSSQQAVQPLYSSISGWMSATVSESRTLRRSAGFGGFWKGAGRVSGAQPHERLHRNCRDSLRCARGHD